ncbi:hypothetical protein [Novosphingobium cyanobacteriorum]|uniref:Uncharacterized protein n=1 Tax=Novosphingobium cyanobacteriorum TaxID=3024215 RepID=A0ABT6CIF8_9SPHN|nr:hypothetical protein [Novosphingobium cyanobacteriorum]MDF8333304.1 hypothetical protein [Novosphingobium cyanobacteriorum]
MLLEPRDAAGQAGAMAIHVQTLRLMVTLMLPEMARLSPDPAAWLTRMEAILLRTADTMVQDHGAAIGPDLTRAAVLESLEQTFNGARAMLELD